MFLDKINVKGKNLSLLFLLLAFLVALSTTIVYATGGDNNNSSSSSSSSKAASCKSNGTNCFGAFIENGFKLKY